MQDQSFVDAASIYLLGQSNRVSVALLVSRGAVTSMFPGKPRFQAITAFYPWCGVLPTWSNKIVSPLLVLAAGADDWVDPGYCVSAREQVSGADYDVVVYDQALHGFDLPIDEQLYLGYRLGGDAAATEDSRENMVEWFLSHRQ